MNRRDLIKSAFAAALTAITRPALALIGLPGGAAVRLAGFPFVVGNSGGMSPGDGGSPPIFQDQLMNSRGFMTAAVLTTRVALDANGWPTADFATYLSETQNYSIAPNWNSGGYACGFTTKGSGTETITAIGGVVSGQAYNSTTKQVTFTLTPTSSASAFGFTVTGTTGGATGVFAMLPGYAANQSYNLTGNLANLFTSEAKTKLSAMPLQRALDWSLVIWNLTTNSWSTRHSPSSVKVGATGYGGWKGNGSVGSGTEGFPVDWFVDLCNQTNSHCWWHNPWYDDGTYAGNAASFVMANLSSSSQYAFFEKINEGWNTGDGGVGSKMPWITATFIAANPGLIDYDTPFNFTASGTSGNSYITAASVPAALAANQQIGGPGITVPTSITSISGTQINLSQPLTATSSSQTFAGQSFGMVARLYAYEVCQMAQQISSAVGGAFGNRANVVLCWQSANVSNFYSMLSYIASKIGNPASYIHWLAQAPYMTRNNSAIPGDAVNHINANDTIAQIQSELTTNGTYRGFLAQSEQLLILALSYGLKGILTYECGWETAGETTAVTNLGAAIMDAGMQTVTTNYLTALQNCGYQLLNNTSWGVVNSKSVLDPDYAMSNDPNGFVTSGSPRFNALSTFQSSPPARTRNVIAASGSTTVDCINYADNSSGLSSTYPTLGSKTVYTKQHGAAGGYNSYHVYSAAGGTYTVSGSFNATATGTTNLDCNGAAISTGVAIAIGTPSTAALGTVTLQAGENYVILGTGSAQSSITPQSLTFTAV